MPTPANDEISSDILTSIASRLRPSCPNIPEGEFQSLVLDVARVKAKYDRRNAAALADFKGSQGDPQRDV
ncbi:MAG TPA: hypothetical protein VGJ18_03425 [Gemmatimonadaceae bacterium]|jgi:hypothetical protein